MDDVARRGVELMVAQAETSLARFRITFDHWFSERSLHEGDPTPVAHAFEVLDGQGRTFREDGALWLRTTDFGDDKDRVLERSNGEHTYFASDIAYHQEKRERGFNLLIDVWGADHHGYVQRMQAAFQALGGAPEQLELLIMQFVHLVEGGERGKMSKRAGEFVTLDDLVDDIGVDAARWFLLARSHDTSIDLDLELARSQSSDNPVYYVQYAHARIASVLRKAGEARVAEALAAPAQVPAHRAAPERARARAAAARLPGGGARGRRPPRAAPDRRLRARSRAALQRVLPRLPGRRRAGRRGDPAPAAQRRDAERARARTRPARYRGSAGDVASPGTVIAPRSTVI